jgi:hypothetical protein
LAGGVDILYIAFALAMRVIDKALFCQAVELGPRRQSRQVNRFKGEKFRRG